MNNGPYSSPQPGQFSPPSPPAKPVKPKSLEERFQALPAWRRFGLIGCSGLMFIGSALFMYVLVASAFPAAQPTTQANLATPSPLPIPTVKPTPTPMPSPTPTPEPTQQQPGAPPASQPGPPAPATGVYGNPWGYDFNSSGSVIANPVPDFCNGTYFSCIASFWNGAGYVEECGDGLYSKSGGRSGSCSKHGGDKATLYQHP